MKLPRYGDYSHADTERCEQALLTVWACLRDYSEHLVLIGGLVPRYLCHARPGELSALTLDVDLGIALAADGAFHDPISVRLQRAGFDPERGTGRFVRPMTRGRLIVDFLTEKPSEDAPDAAMVDDVRAQAILGLDRALGNARVVAVSGTNLDGVHTTEQVRVCEIGPFLCLKLSAYAVRAEAKDVFDVVRGAMDYDGGVEAAIAAFRAEDGQNGVFPRATAVLKERFATASAAGPVAYADFCLSGRSSAFASGDFDRLVHERQNEAWLLGQRLLGMA